jgi:predicted enzyme related to lactoylglutathione lyase
MFLRVDRVLLRVPNVTSAAKFYVQKLGLSIRHQDARAVTLAFPNDDFEMVLHSDPELPSEALFYLVDDVRRMFERREELQLQFLAQPARATRGYRATIKDPFGVVLNIIDRSAADGGPNAAAEDARTAGTLFGPLNRKVTLKPEVLRSIYKSIGRTADDLPYTPEFERLFETYCAHFSPPMPDRSEVWRHILTLRKSGKLPRTGSARSPAVVVDDALKRRLRGMVGADVGKRDRLPYTDRFNEIVDGFNRVMPRPLSPHQVWRLLATLAK